MINHVKSKTNSQNNQSISGINTVVILVMIMSGFMNINHNTKTPEKKMSNAYFSDALDKNKERSYDRFINDSVNLEQI